MEIIIHSLLVEVNKFSNYSIASHLRCTHSRKHISQEIAATLFPTSVPTCSNSTLKQHELITQTSNIYSKCLDPTNEVRWYPSQNFVASSIIQISCYSLCSPSAVIAACYNPSQVCVFGQSAYNITACNSGHTFK